MQKHVAADPAQQIKTTTLPILVALSVAHFLNDLIQFIFPARQKRDTRSLTGK